MLKVFLVEDESIMREGLRDSIPWQQYGYEFVGEAADGEMALPLIRKFMPDVLITDIKMPFMDGLALSEIVTKEFPNVKIIIISGHDDFEYARRAIHVGVEQYLLKPITRNAMQKVLLEVREKIENEQAQKNYLELFKAENHDYEQFSRRHFFERVFEGNLSAQEIYAEAKELSLELNAPYYNLIFFSVSDKQNSYDAGDISASEYIEDIQRYISKYNEYTVFRWNINTYGVLISGEEKEMDSLRDKIAAFIKESLNKANPDQIEWYVAEGTMVNRLSFLSECYREVNKVFSCRFLFPNVNILTKDIVTQFSSEDGMGSDYKNIDVSKIDPEIVKAFLEKGVIDEADDFVTSYLDNLAEPLKSKIFRNYLILNVRFTTLAFAESIGKSQEEFFAESAYGDADEKQFNNEDIKGYMLNLIYTALKLRDEQTNSRGKNVLKKALSYIEENFSNDSLSLNEVATAIDVSPNYFSGLFSAEMDKTFIEYVTEKRMEKAKKLLRTTDKHTRDISLEVGYRDSHYFSFVFKKTQGITPREYRNG